MTESSQNKQILMQDGTNGCQNVKEIYDRLDKKFKSLKIWHLSPEMATYSLTIEGYFRLLEKVNAALQDGDNNLAVELLSQAESILDERLRYIKKLVIGTIVVAILVLGIVWAIRS